MKRNTLIGLFLLLAPGLAAQEYQKTSLGLQTQVGSTHIEIQFFSPSVVRLMKWPTKQLFKKESLSVIQQAQPTKLTINSKGDAIQLKSSALTVELDMKTGKVAYFSPTGLVYLNEKDRGTSFKEVDDAGSKAYEVAQTFQLDKNEAIYGLGQQQRGQLSLRGVRMNMVQGNVDDFVPFLVSTKGYGLFWDNYSPTLFEDKEAGTAFTSEIGDGIDYYFMAGGNMDGTIAKMRSLTGQVPMFPLWTFGFWQSKERYKSQNELLDVVKKYRESEVPLDGIIQDWQYWGNNYLWNAMEFLNPEFDNAKKMIDDVHAMNAHMMISIWASFGPHTKQFKELEKINALYNFKTWPESGLEKWPPNLDYPSGVRVYDPFNPAAREIYWKYLNKGIFSLGMDGWWMDSTEPDNFDNKPSNTYLGSYRKVRNAFPLMSVGGVYDRQRATSSDKRVFILTRSAFAGQQRYGASTWSGDVNSSWQSLRNQVPAGLNFSLSAIPYWNSDIGGFFAGSYNNNWNDGSGAKNPAFQELYVRWLQFGAFTPMMRSHGTEVPREIYNFGVKGEPIYDAIAKSIHLRYSLLPYIYSTAWDVTQNQYTFMRALVMDFDDQKVVNMNNEYMFGKSILVAPVLNAQYTPETIVKSTAENGWNKGEGNSGKNGKIDFTKAKSMKIYLPKGTSWFDFWTNEKHNGGQEIEKKTTIDEIPLYIKAGSIIPFGPKVQYASEKKWDNLELNVYGGANGEFNLYEDENDNYNYEKGHFSTIKFNWDEKARRLTIGAREGKFNGMLTSRKFNIVALVGDKKVTKQVTYTGKSVKVDL